MTHEKVAIKKIARPFESAVHAKRTYRELRMLKHMNHKNVCTLPNKLNFSIVKDISNVTKKVLIFLRFRFKNIDFLTI